MTFEEALRCPFVSSRGTTVSPMEAEIDARLLRSARWRGQNLWWRNVKQPAYSTIDARAVENSSSYVINFRERS